MDFKVIGFVVVALLAGAYLGKKFPQANLLSRFLP